MCQQIVELAEEVMRRYRIGMQETFSKAISMLEARQADAGDSLGPTMRDKSVETLI